MYLCMGSVDYVRKKREKENNKVMNKSIYLNGLKIKKNVKTNRNYQKKNKMN